LDSGCKFHGKGYDISVKLYLSYLCFFAISNKTVGQRRVHGGLGKIRCCAIVVLVEVMEHNASDIRREKGGIDLGLLRKREGW